jgi:hypothetical protein
LERGATDCNCDEAYARLSEKRSGVEAVDALSVGLLATPSEECRLLRGVLKVIQVSVCTSGATKIS